MDFLKERYQRSVALGIKLVDLDSRALAGYYLTVYPGDPIGALLRDIASLRVSTVAGLPAKVLILSQIQRDKYCKES